MKIRDLNFNGFVFGQAGVQGFFGEPDEHKIHKYFRMLFSGFSFLGMVFVAKTITLHPRIYPDSSNTELYDEYKLERLFPKSIWFSFRSFIKGYMLNAVGLANPGAKTMLSLHKWQERGDIFQVSFMPVEKTLFDKLIEVELFCVALLTYMPVNEFHKYALQINFSCPNTGHNQKQDVVEIISILEVFRARIPNLVLIPKFNLLVEPETITKLKPFCDAFCISNSLEFGKKQSEEWWKKLFPEGKSPLLKYFGGKFSGGLSGAPLFPLLIDWLKEMEKVDNSVVIIAGGGIMKKKDIFLLSKFKIVHAIALGAVASLRPWRLQSLIKYGNKIFEKRETQKT